MTEGIRIAKKGLRPSGVYVRMGSASVPATDNAIRTMVRETDGDSFEVMRSLNQDLTFVVADQEFLNRGVTFQAQQMKTLGLINDNGLYTNLGLLLSDQSPHTIKIALFQGDSRSVFRDRRELSGSLFKQLQDVYEYIDLHNKTHAEIEGLYRKDRRDYPEAALRETLLNAIVHREYSFGGSTLISIFENRMECVTPGGLAPGLSLEAIMLGVSRSRNERLADVFYRLRLIEAYGTGIGKILESYTGQTRQPEFIAVDGAFKVILPNCNQHCDIAQQSGIDNASALLNYLARHREVSRFEVQSLLGIGQTASGNLLRSLQQQGKIVVVGSGKQTKYRLA